MVLAASSSLLQPWSLNPQDLLHPSVIHKSAKSDQDLEHIPNAPPDGVCLKTAGKHGMEDKRLITGKRVARASHSR